MSANEPIKIPPEDLPLLLNAILSERLLGAARSLGEGGRWWWTYPDPKGGDDAPVLRTDHPVLSMDESRCDDVLMMLNNLSHSGQPFNWAFGRRPVPPEYRDRGVTQWYGCRLFAPDDSGAVVSEAGAEVMSTAIALAIVRLTGADLQAEHRVMFPHRYLVLNS